MRDRCRIIDKQRFIRRCVLDVAHRGTRDIASDFIFFIKHLVRPRSHLPAFHRNRIARLTSDKVAILNIEGRLIGDIGRHAEEVVKADIQRTTLDFGAIPIIAISQRIAIADAEVPLTKSCGAIAIGLQELRQRFDPCFEEHIRTRRPHHPCRRMQFAAPPIAPGQHTHPRLRASRRRRIGIGKAYAIVSQAINVRRVKLSRAIATQVAVTEIIAKDKQDIWFRPFGAAHGRQAHHRWLLSDCDIQRQRCERQTTKYFWECHFLIIIFGIKTFAASVATIAI